MPPGEMTVICPGCSYEARMPFAAIRRNNLYCPQCGRNIPLTGVQPDPASAQVSNARAKPKKSSRPMRRR
jgi:hypothetical protein